MDTPNGSRKLSCGDYNADCCLATGAVSLKLLGKASITVDEKDTRGQTLTVWCGQQLVFPKGLAKAYFRKISMY
jgi:hypothetical protein